MLAYSETAKKATYKYHAAKIKRVPLDMQLSDYARIKAAADSSGETVNGWIKRAIRERLARDAGNGADNNSPGQQQPTIRETHNSGQQ